MKNIIELARHFLLFCGVGAINTVVTLLIILFLTHFQGFGDVTANVIGYAVGVCIGFGLHRAITFRKHAREGHMHKQALSFLIIFGVGYVTQLGCLVVMTKFWGWPSFVSQVVACGIYVVISFTGNRFGTFAGKTTQL
jgi:putative flippase GtrA